MKNNLLDRYLQGSSDLTEEKNLFDQQDQDDEAVKAWSIYQKQQAKQPPASLKNSIRLSIQQKQRKLQAIRATFLSVAAMITVFFFVWIYNIQETKEMTLKEKEEILNEALMLFENEEIPQSKVLYEDEMIIIYMAPKKSEQASVNLEKILEQF